MGSEASRGSGRGNRGEASTGLRTENNSLSLTLAEAEEMARRLSNKKSRSGSGFSGRWWFKKRKSSRGRTGSSSSPPSSVEGSPQPEGARAEGGRGARRDENRLSQRGETRASQRESSSSSLSHSSGSENQVADMIAAVAAPAPTASASSDDRELTPGSIQSAEFESGNEEEVFHGMASSEARSSSQRSGVNVEVTLESRTSEGAVGLTPSSGEGGLRDRQTSIVHASNLTNADQVAAARARATAKKKGARTRLSTDELTNQGT